MSNVTDMRASGASLRIHVVVIALVFTIYIFSTQLSSEKYAPVRSNIVEVYNRPLNIQQEEHLNRGLAIQDVVVLPADEFLVTISTNGDKIPTRNLMGTHCSVTIGNSDTIRAQVVGAGYLGSNRGIVKYRAVGEGIQWNTDDQVTVSVELRSGKLNSAPLGVLLWNRLVFEAVSTDEDVVVFTKGIFPVGRKEDQENATECVFFDGEELITTEILGLSQEVVRCKHPPLEIRDRLLGKRISVKTSESEISMPTMAFYESPSTSDSSGIHRTTLYTGAPLLNKSSSIADARNRHLVCACTMVSNVAKFLREWVLYHSHLGVEKFFLYDNNSEDNLEEIVHELDSDGSSASVVRRTWPWIKTQEAGFSHCALTARSECEWMAFVDVDEFIFPRYWIRNSSVSESLDDDTRILARVINDAKRKTIPQKNATGNAVGQISFRCRNFGPSMHRENPGAGVTQGYTCRVAKEQRHKSLVLLDAVDWSLFNVIHHFQLSQGFTWISVPAWRGVVNHYKYQAWDEFKHKFKRRVSAYVVDWTEEKNIKSQDRTPGLGIKAVKPGKWESMFCDVEDTALRDYVLSVFGSPDSLPWRHK